MIPKKIFYVWGAGEIKKRDVQVCIQTWRQAMPDYEIIEINQDSTEYFNFAKELSENKWFRTVYERKMWAYIADYVRIKTLYDNGGIYFDTDVSSVKNMDAFLENPAFVGIQDSKLDGWNNLVEPAVLGAERNNPFLKQILDFYNDCGENTIWTLPIYTMPEVFKYFLDKNYGIQNYPKKCDQEIIKYKDITLYPERYFIPFRFGKTFAPECVEPDTHTIHWFGGSWTDAKTVNFLSNKHKAEFLQRYSSADWKFYRIFGFIPFLSVRKMTDKSVSFFLFNRIPVYSVLYKKQNTVYKLFNLIPLFGIKRKSDKTIYRLFNLLCIFVIRNKLDVTIYRLFGILPIMKIWR